VISSNPKGNDLPAGWSVSPLEDVADILDGKRVPINAKERETRTGQVPYYGATGQVGWIDDYLFDEELVLLGEDGAPFLDSSKPKAYVIRGKSWVNNHAHVLSAKDGTPNAYLKYFLDRFDYHGFVTGTTRLKLTQRAMRQIPIPLPSPDDRRRIVAEIDKQFSRLAEAVANLKRTKANLKRYKAAVLKAAVEGKLTEAWRKQHPDVEPASKLLERILGERRAKWSGKGKYKEPIQPDLTTTAQIPSHWKWTSVDQISSLVTDGDHNPPKRVPAGVPHLTAKHIKEWRITFEGCSYISQSDFDRTRSRFEPSAGDVIVTCVGTVGQTAIVQPGIKFSADRNLAGVRLVEGGVLPRFVQIVLNTPQAQIDMKQASGSTAQPHLYLGDLRAFTVPLPSIVEQQQIVAEVERRLSVIDELEATVEANLTRADRLRQSILSEAFSGRLVRQGTRMWPKAVPGFSLAAEAK